MCPSLDEAAFFDHGLDALDKHFLQIDRLLAPQTLRGKYVIVWLVIGLWLVRIKNTCLSGRSLSSKSDLVSSLGVGERESVTREKRIQAWFAVQTRVCSCRSTDFHRHVKLYRRG